MAFFCKTGLMLFLLSVTGACAPDEVSYKVELCDVKKYGNESFYLLSDAGNILHPSISLTSSSGQGQRFRVTYIELEDNNAPGDEVTVQIKSMLPVLVKDAVNLSAFSGKLGDPVSLVGSPWFGGGYLNFEFSYENDEASGIKHEIHLVQDSLVQNKLYMTFGHDANGDLSKEKVTALASFPLTSIPGFEDADSLILQVRESSGKIYRMGVRHE